MSDIHPGKDHNARRKVSINPSPAIRLKVLNLLRDYRGLPLSHKDIVEELNMDPARAKIVLDDYVTSGLIGTRPDPFMAHRPLYWVTDKGMEGASEQPR